MTLQMKNDVFWSNFEMDSSGESGDAYIPGLSKKGNRRPRIKCKKTSEIKAKIPVKQPQVETYTPRSKQMSSLSSDDTIESRMNKENKRQYGKVSLKDLCSEDKKRVANLIKELARVGDEKEKCMGLLKNERENFESQVLTLVQQQEQILKEREDVQERLFQCHELLSKYQDQILDKEKKLNESLQEQQVVSKFNQYPFHPVRDGARSPFSQRSTSPASYQGRSPRDIQSQRRVSRDEIKSKVDRPVTSMIDKEIALHKSYDGPSTIMPDQSNYQREPLKSSFPRNFREPIMSSTQKSVDIHPFVSDSQDLFPLIPDMSPRSTSQESKGHTPRLARHDVSVKNKVGFKDKIESDENLQYSPNLHQSQIGDREYMKHYKKLKPSERKRELLKQRENLMEEQNRLQQVLQNQEEQLRDRQQQLIEKRKMQHEKINSLEGNFEFHRQDDGSVFNGRVDKLDFDKHLSDVDDDDIPNEAAEMVHHGRISRHSIATSPLPQTPPTAEKGTSISRMECSVQANIPDTPPRADVGTSISRLGFSYPMDDICHTPPRNDVGTSISRVFQPSQPDIQTTPSKRDVDKFIDKMTEVTTSLSAMSPRSPSSRLQGNLPLPSNRGRSIVSSAAKAPGDKTLSVVDIVNSLDEDFCSPQVFENYRSPITKPSSKVNSPHIKSTRSPYREVIPQRTSVGKQNHYDDESTIEEQEESHILEDIFFLK